MRRRVVAAALTALMGLGAAACSTPVGLEGSAPTDDDGATADTPPEPTVTPTPSPTPDPDATPTPEPVTINATERLWVVNGDGELSTMAPDGSEVVPLTPDGDDVVDLQPAWSPDADRLVWVRVDPVSGDARLVSSRADRTAHWELPVEDAPFYLQWDPSSSRVAALAAGEGAFELSVAEVGTDDALVTVDRGAPYFFSWGPSGDEVLVHAGGFRLDLVELDGSAVIVEELPAEFQTPVWTADERALLFADEVDGEQFLVASGREGQGRLPLIRYDGYLQFVVAAPTRRIALQVLPESPIPVPEVITAGLPGVPAQSDPLDPVDDVPRNQLVVIPTFGGEAFVITEEPSIAFFWSADGSVLAWLQDVDRGDDQRWMRWSFWDTATVWSSPDFVPTETFVDDYLPFFDQYAQSLSFFSPDASAFVYTGTDDSGVSGVWVLPLDPFATPERIADGEIAAWSPATAGSAAANAP